jgi:hypothetical protein
MPRHRSGCGARKPVNSDRQYLNDEQYYQYPLPHTLSIDRFLRLFAFLAANLSLTPNFLHSL